MAHFIRIISAGLALGAGLSAMPAAAETLRIAGVYPAESDGAASLNSIAVERFGGVDGDALAFAVADRLREAEVQGEPWFTVLVQSRAEDADAVLTGYAQPTYADTDYKSKREICWAEDDRGRCIERREVELDCVRISITLRPEMRLVGYNGNLLWSSDIQKNRQLSYCPELDTAPDGDPAIREMVDEVARDVRYRLAPAYRVEDIRIMERRRGLEGDARDEFRDAIRLTRTDEAAACAQFARLHTQNPDHPALSFNVGLCAEQRYDIDAAEAAYNHALQFEDSDDEAQAGLQRLRERMRADRQMANHHGA